MSYVNMDHAEWAQGNIRAGKQLLGKRRPAKNRHGAVVGPLAAPNDLTPVQCKIMNILGIAGGGIYNAPISWDTIDWNCGRGVSLLWDGSLATVDGNGLTKLVMLCHDARIRCAISPAGPRHLRLTFHPRVAIGGYSDRHPNLEEAVAQHRATVPLTHSIAYAEAHVLAPLPTADAATTERDGLPVDAGERRGV